MEFLPAAFEALAQYPQFIIYQLVQNTQQPGKLTKLPVSYLTGRTSDAHDPAIWLTAVEAIEHAKRLGTGYGVGFTFTESDPFFFLDIDNCLEPCGTKWSPLALSLLAAFSGAAVEVSSSGRGLHIIGAGIAPPHSCRNAAYGLELYTSRRFVALTGTQAGGCSGYDLTAQLDWLVTHYFPAGDTATASSGNVGQQWAAACSAPVATDYSGGSDDEDLIRRALQSRSGAQAFGGKATFRDLWECNTDALRATWPDDSHPCGYDESRADGALAQALAFWTGKDHERIYMLMLQSQLVRDKWDRNDYLQRTILGACSRQTEYLCTKPVQINATLAPDQAPRGVRTGGNRFLDVDQQIEAFAGCVYIQDEHKVLTPGGYLLSPDKFRAMYGGFTMVMDDSNSRTTRNAFEAFTESQVFSSPKATGTCFQPRQAPGAIIVTDGEPLANTYWPVKTASVAGDVTPFLTHVAKLLPVERDRQILIAYLAALVQHVGVKFKWCPLIQGVEGNGKTLFTKCIANAIGNRYTHFPKSAELASKFNDWLYGKLFAGVEDIYFPDSRLEIMETIKTMITGEHQEIEPKGGAKRTREVCINFILNSNHKDALRKTRNDRRFAPFYTAQQSLEDLKRDGMVDGYFRRLYDWLNNGGYANVTNFLQNSDIPDDFNPVTCERAPITSSTEQAIEASMGNAEQEIVEAIEAGSVGFRGSWVSSYHLDALLTRVGANRRYPFNKRRELMQTLGYDWHPALKDGRLTKPLLCDAMKKSRLYIKHGTAEQQILNIDEVLESYVAAQEQGAPE